VIPAAAVLVQESTGSPSGPVRAFSREAWSSISANRPSDSVSWGVRLASMRPSRNASAHRSVRIHESPLVAEYPSLKTR
jgi:hypothetical protein